MTINMTSFATPLTRLLGCRYPVISAGMGGPARESLPPPFPMQADLACWVRCANHLS